MNCVNFLTSLFNSGNGYSSLNSARSALSTFLINEYGLTIGNSPFVKRFMKGVFELKPPLPRYKFIWDVSIVLNFLSNYFPNENLPLNVLTYKCVMLLALASMQRVQTLSSINISDIYFTNDSVVIPIFELLKQFRPRNNKLIVKLNYYPDCPEICPGLTLKHYLKRTKDIRGLSNKLFISFQKPFKAVGVSTLSRWIKRVMSESGIDTDYFKAHSTRAAASSCAHNSDMPIDEIISIAGWSNARTFQLFYNKVVANV